MKDPREPDDQFGTKRTDGGGADSPDRVGADPTDGVGAGATEGVGAGTTHSVSPDPTQRATILPLVSREGDRRLLSEWVDGQSGYEVLDSTVSVSSVPFDLCVADAEGFQANAETLLERRREAAPVLLPVLLLLPAVESGRLGAARQRLGDQTLQTAIDEVVSLPIEKPELDWRVRTLLRLRSQSLRLRARERELREFHRATEAAGHAVYITDSEGTIEYVNPAFERITGFEAEEAVGRNPRILRSGEMPDGYYKQLWETVTAGETWEESVINRRRDGERYVAQQTIAPILDEAGGVEAFVAVQTDITERTDLETELREKTERFETLFASIRDAILVADTDRRITDCNQAFTDLFGFEREEILGEPTSVIYESQAEFERLGEALSGGLEDENVVTVHYQKRSGRVFPGETNVFYIRGEDGETQGFIGLIRDVSDRRDRIEQLQVIDRVLRHNLHNDLNVIEGHAENIRESATGPHAHAADRILETGKKLLATADKEREITKLLSDRPAQLTLDLPRLLSKTVEDCRERHPRAEIDLDVPEACEITATPSIETALEELLENAVVHADRSAPTVSVGIETAGDTATVTVADDGPGIPEMEQAVLSREADIEPLYHGSGLGLWLVNLIVGQSDGVLAFEDNEPRGSVVSITLPLA